MGEVDVEDGQRAEPLVRARLARPVDGLDTALWEQALEVRRGYDARVAAGRSQQSMVAARATGAVTREQQ
ncbi:hypothetical protein T492DRAFT_958388 [Pavlovales sp. CCMP2436]|nr:hypothetical protein T492DRAFT_958388 [Pavlovales sp. CCMP2436]